MSIAERTDENGENVAVPVTIPALNGHSKLDYWLALAAGGCFTLPVKPKSKSPGSILGRAWQFQSSRHPEQIQEWNRIYPRAEIGIHTGASGIVVFDLDVDEIPEELAFSRTGLYQSTRSGLLEWDAPTERGHYVFSSDTVFVSGKLKTAEGTVVGEIRSGNSIILTQPSRHQKEPGAGYLWMKTGLAPPVPSEANNYLRPLANGTPTTASGTRSLNSLVHYLADLQSSDDELNSWAETAFHDGSAEGMCAITRAVTDKWLTAIKEEEASYPNLSGGHWEILHLAAEGHTGWNAACNELDEIYYVEVAEIRQKRLPTVVRDEMRRSRRDAIRKIKGEADQKIAIGAMPVFPVCTCPNSAELYVAQNDW